MTYGTPREWADALHTDVKLLPGSARRLLEVARRLDDQIVGLRTFFHGCPDPELEELLYRLEAESNRLVERLGAFHDETHKEIG